MRIALEYILSKGIGFINIHHHFTWSSNVSTIINFIFAFFSTYLLKILSLNIKSCIIVSSNQHNNNIKAAKEKKREGRRYTSVITLYVHCRHYCTTNRLVWSQHFPQAVVLGFCSQFRHTVQHNITFSSESHLKIGKGMLSRVIPKR